MVCSQIRQIIPINTKNTWTDRDGDVFTYFEHGNVHLLKVTCEHSQVEMLQSVTKSKSKLLVKRPMFGGLESSLRQWEVGGFLICLVSYHVWQKGLCLTCANEKWITTLFFFLKLFSFCKPDFMEKQNKVGSLKIITKDPTGFSLPTCGPAFSTANFWTWIM